MHSIISPDLNHSLISSGKLKPFELVIHGTHQTQSHLNTIQSVKMDDRKPFFSVLGPWSHRSSRTIQSHPGRLRQVTA